MRLTGVPLPEIPELGAPTPIADLYADIRRTLGVPRVNLVYRALATVPGLLSWLWPKLAPLYTSGWAASVADRIAGDETPLPLIAPIPHSVQPWMGITPEGRETWTSVLESFNSANRRNLVALTWMNRTLTGGAHTQARQRNKDSGVEWQGGSREAASMLGLDDSSSPVVDVLLTMVQEQLASVRIVPSLYRHLAESPALLVCSWLMLRPLFLDGRLRGAAGALSLKVAHVVDSSAPSFVHDMGEQLGELGPGAKELGIGLIAEFLEVIPQMVLAGEALWSAFFGKDAA